MGIGLAPVVPTLFEFGWFRSGISSRPVLQVHSCSAVFFSVPRALQMWRKRLARSRFHVVALLLFGGLFGSPRLFVQIPALEA